MQDALCEAKFLVCGQRGLPAAHIMADEVAELAICRCQRAFPKRLPEEAIALLAGMECDLIDEEDIEEDWLRTLVDSPYPGPVREAVKLLAAEVTRT